MKLQQGINEVLGNTCDEREGGIVKRFCSSASLFPETRSRSLPTWFHCDHIISNRSSLKNA